MPEYIYEFSDYPPGEALVSEHLVTQVHDEAAITTTLQSVWVCSTQQQVGYVFESTLSQAESDALDALVAAYTYETLTGAKIRCFGECRDWLDNQLDSGEDAPPIQEEYPAASGKMWGITRANLAEWNAMPDLSAGSFPVKLWSVRGADSITLADQEDVSAFLSAMADGLYAAVAACSTAQQNVWDATTIALAEAARDAYIGG